MSKLFNGFKKQQGIPEAKSQFKFPINTNPNAAFIKTASKYEIATSMFSLEVIDRVT